MTSDRTDSITRKVRAMRPKRYTVKDAAALVGRSPDTLRRWRQDGLLEPSETQSFGSTVVHLYTPDDLKELRKIAKVQRSGPKPKEPVTGKRNSHAPESNGQEDSAPKVRKRTRRTSAR